MCSGDDPISKEFTHGRGVPRGFRGVPEGSVMPKRGIRGGSGGVPEGFLWESAYFHVRRISDARVRVRRISDARVREARPFARGRAAGRGRCTNARRGAEPDSRGDNLGRQAGAQYKCPSTRGVSHRRGCAARRGGGVRHVGTGAKWGLMRKCASTRVVSDRRACAARRGRCTNAHQVVWRA